MTNPCPVPSALLLLALDATPEHEAAIVMEHLHGCGSCRAAIREVREAASLLQSADRTPSLAGDCLDEIALARWVDEGQGPKQRAHLIHLAACAPCRERISSVSALLRDPTIDLERVRAEETTHLPRTRRWRVAGVSALAGAAAIALLVGRPLDPAHTTASAPTASGAVGVHREPGMTTTPAPTPIAPIGVVATLETFRWTSVPRADLYRVTLFDREGTTVWRGEGTDTAMVIPRGLVAGEAATLYWRVDARTGWDRWVESELVEFSRVPSKRTP